MSEGVRQFPCERCGAKVEFAPGTDSLVCPYCGDQTHIPAADTAAIVERPYEAVLAELDASAEVEEVWSVQCGSCAASVEPSPSQEAFPCPYCGSSIAAGAKSQRLIKPQALLPFKIDRHAATERFRHWIRKLWFAPNALKKLARIEERLQGLYAPYWTYDADTVSRYTGERGDEYTVTRTRTVERNGRRQTETYQDTEVRWTRVSGRVSRDFDDMLVVGSSALPRSLAEALEPWDLGNLVVHDEAYLSGFTAERYQVDLPSGWQRACERMEDVIRGDVRRDIGGDQQRIHTLQTAHSDITFKHILLPMWICSYRYKQKVYRFLVNARTGEVQGQRPWSRIKIAFAVAAVLGLILAVYLYGNS